MRATELASRILGTAATRLFHNDVTDHEAQLADALGGRRVLAVGGAGTIGTATVKAVLARRPACIHVVDHDENRLVELVRELRGRSEGLGDTELRSLPLDMASTAMCRFLTEGGPYDYVLNFAALKHVRSEKDSASLLTLLDTNVVKTARLLRWLAAEPGTGSFFSVSTDKAASPAGMMGASKRIMEHVMFSGDVVPRDALKLRSARFANVAFSNGSLLAGFLERMDKGQPLAAPKETRRFFVTPEQSGWICLLAGVLVPDGHLAIPRPGVGVPELGLADVAARVIESEGLEPSIYEDEDEARASMAADLARGRYPLLLTPRDTSGEKPFEIFVADGEEAVEIGYRDLVGVSYREGAPGAVTSFLEELQHIVSDPGRAVGKETLVELVGSVVPELSHVETGRSLDERM